jgi:hypothetical protein
MLPLTLRPATRLNIEIPWPRVPVITETGRVSKAKDAGKPIPWLSTNVVQSLLYVPPGQEAKAFSRQHVQALKRQWHQAAVDAAGSLEGEEQLQLQHRVAAEIQLYRNPANQMDWPAIIEGAKPLIDGLVDAGLLIDDSRGHVEYDRRSNVYPTPKGTQRVVILLRTAA